jgi:alpha-tubulin suppressor-like RCC1 family protein
MVKSYGGAVKSWGEGAKGQLGSGEGSNQNTPRQVNYIWNTIPPTDVDQICLTGHTSYIKTTSGVVYGSGDNTNGQIGQGASDVKNRTMFVPIPIPAPVVNVATSGVHYDWMDRCSTFFTTNSGVVYALGFSASYQTGAGTTADLRVPTLVFNTRPIQKIIPVMRCTYLLATDGSVWAAGENNDGQLAQGNTVDKQTFSQCLVSAGTPISNIVKVDAHCRRYDDGTTVNRQNLVFAINSAGRLYGAGYNSSTQYLGTGTSADNVFFTQVSSLSSKVIVDVSIGGSLCSTIAVTNTGEIYTWGYNGRGQLGLGDTTNRSTPTLVNTWNGPGAVPWLGKVKKVYVSKNSSIPNIYILTTDGQLFVSGENNYGEAGPWDNNYYVAASDFKLFTNITTIKLLPTEIIDDFVVLGQGSRLHILAKTNLKRLLATGANDLAQTGISTNNSSVFGLSEVRLH